MKTDTTPEWLERAQAEIVERIQGMTPEEEAEYWLQRSKEFNEYKQQLRTTNVQAKSKVA